MEKHLAPENSGGIGKAADLKHILPGPASLHKPLRIQFVIVLRKNFASPLLLLAHLAVSELPAVSGCHLALFDTMDHAAQPIVALRPGVGRKQDDQVSTAELDSNIDCPSITEKGPRKGEDSRAHRPGYLCGCVV